MIQFLFSISLFVNAALLFVIQPMVAKGFLPFYGGTPTVWTVCILFFQFCLLAGYSYAWLLSHLRSRHLWRWVHLFILLLAFASWPLHFQPSLASHWPEVSILMDLIHQLGFPLLVIASSAPLLQFAYSLSKGKQAFDPYFLYAASNLGSLLGLLSYPWVIERFSGLSLQFKGWNYLYALGLLLMLIIFLLPYKPLVNPTTLRRPFFQVCVERGLWILYSFIPCSLMLGVTFYITADIAVTPLFWVLPLALYLLSFVITFAKKTFITQETLKDYAFYALILPVIGFVIGLELLSIWQIVLLHLLYFTIIALYFHSELVMRRPPAEQLTSFYLCLAIGGVLAGIYNGIVAPHFFKGAYEYPFIIIFAALLMLVADIKNKMKALTSASLLFILCCYPFNKSMQVLDQQRNFYGIKQVAFTSGAYALLSQNTVHGFQLKNAFDLRNGSMGYYGPVQPVMNYLQDHKKSIQGTVIGLGTGMLACQFRPEDKVDMVDIDEQVIHIAQDSRFFTYLKDCPPKIKLELGDGRLVLKDKQDHSLDVVIVDAFSSDAIPTHLLTYEAIALYQQKMRNQGALLLNISNRHIQLLPVLTAAGRALDLMVLQLSRSEDAKSGQFASEWVLLTMNEPLAYSLMNQEGWRFISTDNQLLWTDNYTNLIPLLKTRVS